MFSFLKHFGIKKAEQAQLSIVDFLTQLDPETASEADINRLDEILTDLTSKMVVAKNDYNREQNEYVAINNHYEKIVASIKSLQNKLETISDETERSTILGHIDTLVTELESLQPKVLQEKTEAEEAKVYFEELQEAVKSAAEKLKTARSDLKNAARQMELAKTRNERVKEKEERAKILAGIKNDTSKISSALSAMQRKTDQLNLDTEVSSEKFKLVSKSDNDPLKDALNAAENKSAAPSLEDRLKKLNL